jgi:surface antigen
MASKKQIAITLVLASSLLGGCQNAGQKETAATVVGTIAGGIIGAQFGHHGGRVAGAAIGALVGALLGNAIGHKMDEEDIRSANRAFATATRAPVGQTIYWSNSRTGNWGYYRPIRDGHRRFDGLYCREFTTTATINGRTERVGGTACRHPNGTWEAM